MNITGLKERFKNKFILTGALEESSVTQVNNSKGPTTDRIAESDFSISPFAENVDLLNEAFAPKTPWTYSLFESASILISVVNDLKVVSITETTPAMIAKSPLSKPARATRITEKTT
jgi:hypothetical protein